MKEDYLGSLREFIFKQDQTNWKKLNFKKGQQICLSEVHLIASGEVEIFLIGENGELIKVRNFGPKDVFIGLDSYFGIEKLSPIFRVKSKTTLIKIPREDFHKLFNNMNFSNWIAKLIFYRLIDAGFNLLLRSNASSKELIKHLLISECQSDNTIIIDNITDFVDKYNIKRSTFYMGLKQLEDLGEIQKEGKKITLLKQGNIFP